MNEKRALGMMDSLRSRIAWRTSSYSGNGGGQCVQVGLLGGLPLLRDSKSPEGPVLALSPEEWKATLDRIKGGEFDLT